MPTLAELRNAFGSAWHVNAEAIYALLASDGSAGAGSFTNLTATGNVALGDNVADTFALYGKTPIAQPAHAGQAAYTASTLTALGTIAFSTAAAGVWGFQTSTAAKSIRTQLNKVITDLPKASVLLLRLRTDLIALGAVKGGA